MTARRVTAARAPVASNGHAPGHGLPAASRTEGGKPDVHLTDLGNARRVVAAHGESLRFCHPWKHFLVWDGRRWAEDETAAAVRMVKDTQGALYRWAAARLAELAAAARNDGADAEAAAKRQAATAAVAKELAHALKWEDARRITACLELVKSEPGVHVLPAELDRDPWLLNCWNGTLDLRTGDLRSHRREDLITKLCPVAYDPAAVCPTWLRFLDRIMAGNANLINYLRRVVGYSLTGDVREQCLFFFHGGGANGKSTFLDTCLGMFADYGCKAVSELLMQKNHEAHPTERADLFGRRFVATIETDEGKRMAEALTKELTGDQSIKGRRMRQGFFEIPVTWKLFLAANHKPAIRGIDHAVWHRIKLVPFTVTIAEAEKDKLLPDKLKAEWPGILAWAVGGCLAWQRGGLCEPEEVTKATQEYRGEQDTVCNFIAECCVLHPEVCVKSTALFETYGRWSGDRITTSKAFTTRLRNLGYPSERGTGGYWFYRGVGLPAQDLFGE